MNQRELFQATCAHVPHDEFLFYMNFTPDLKRRVCEAHCLDEDANLREVFGMYNPVGLQLQPPEGQEAPDFSVYYEDYDRPEGSYINYLGVLNIPANFYHFTGYVSPLRNAQRFDDIESFPYPDLSEHTEEHMAEQVQTAHEEGRPAICWVGHIYENAWQIRGYQQFLEDMMDRPEWCEYILDRLMERNKIKACAAARAGADMLRTGDDVANQETMMFSPDQWGRFLKVRWAEIYEAARSIKPDIEIWYHSDGNLEAVIPELVEIGVTILNPVQPECMDPKDIKARWGDKLVLDGTIGTQSTMPWGSPEEVRSVIRQRKKDIGYDGGLILSPTHVLEPEVPLENIRAFIDEAGGILPPLAGG